MCTGAYLLAAAGLLEGRRATTHWNLTDGQAAPRRRGRSDPVFVRDGDIWTSAGVTAGMDLSLALVEEDLGPGVALAAAHVNLSERSYARAIRREVGQTPAAYVEALRVERARALLEGGAPSLEGVARATGFHSAEVLRRAFHRRVGVTPAAHRERLQRAA